MNDKITPKPGVQCLVLTTGNSEKRIYFASKFDNCAYVLASCRNTYLKVQSHKSRLALNKFYACASANALGFFGYALFPSSATPNYIR